MELYIKTENDTKAFIVKDVPLFPNDIKLSIMTLKGEQTITIRKDEFKRIARSL